MREGIRDSTLAAVSSHGLLLATEPRAGVRPGQTFGGGKRAPDALPETKERRRQGTVGVAAGVHPFVRAGVSAGGARASRGAERRRLERVGVRPKPAAFVPQFS